MSKYEDKDHEQIGYERERGRQRYIEEQKNKKIEEINKHTFLWEQEGGRQRYEEQRNKKIKKIYKHTFLGNAAYIIIGLMLVLFLIGLIQYYLL